MEPKISVILPTYNGEKYIVEAIESVLSQDMNDWELIIVNDCSTDGTQKIIEEYSVVDSRIKVINNEENKKLPKTLNVGFENAKGKYLTWTSDDNVYLAEAFSTLYKYLEDHNDVYMVCARMRWIDSVGNFIRDGEKYDSVLMNYADYVGACFMYRRQVLDEIGGYNPDYFLVEDYEYWFRIIEKYGEIAYIDKVLYSYRQQENSLTATRLKDIEYNTAVLRKKYINLIVKNLKDRKDLIVKINYELKKFGILDVETRGILKRVVPELEIDDVEEIKKNIIVYGAGNYGERVYLKYGDKISYYADQNPTKIGKSLNGIEIIPFSRIKEISDNYVIVVAAEDRYSMLRDLFVIGIKHCYVYVEGT